MTNANVQTSMFDVWRNNAFVAKNLYQTHQTSYIPDLLPEIAVQLGVYEVMDILYKRLGFETLQKALNPAETITSPVSHHADGSWLKTSNMVGVNVRTIDNFFNVVKYALTIPKIQDSIHLLPIWEPGVVGSLYGMTSFNINHVFFSRELAEVFPHLDNVEKQLKVTVNILHAMGKSVGMDVIPHTDRFSEMVLLHPRFFEWVHRAGGEMVSHAESLYHNVENIIWQFLTHRGSANGTPLSYDKDTFFSYDVPILSESQRSEILFGFKGDFSGRLNRRLELMQQLLYQGYETLPMTMAPPYRGLHINPNDFVVDEVGNRWYTYEFDKPEGMSRVFGPLARFKFYHSKDDNRHWELDFQQPNKPAWEYISQQYFQCQQQFGFDFMRGDMAHVQPRPSGVPKEIDTYYDPLLYIKKYVQKQGVRHFGFFAETFLAPPNVMGYGDELDHLEAIAADSTLGDLQASVVGSDDYLNKFQHYYKWMKTRHFAPNYTLITADKDDPRFDIFYRTANHLRMFVGLFLSDMPSYMGLGFESRNLHLERGKNEEYTKLYVFEIRNDEEVDKVTHGKYEWGRNFEQFRLFEEMKFLADTTLQAITQSPVNWKIEPTHNQKIMVWEIGNFTFVANLDSSAEIDERTIKKFIQHKSLIFSTSKLTIQHECRIYAGVL